MYAKVQLSCIIVLFLTIRLIGQTESDSTLFKLPTSDSLSSFAFVDSTATDSLAIDIQQVLMSKDSLDAPVEYSARDSMEYDIANQKIYLFGNAVVKYQTLTLKAGYIEFDWGSNIVTAEGGLDSLGKVAELPSFEDRDQNFTAKRMRYNFKTQKGIIYDVTTKQQNLNVLGSRSKFVRTESIVPGTDSTQVQDIIYSEDAIFTTCDHPEPHFGIRSTKQKVIPNKLIIIGPSRLEIAGIPTPFYLPFGFFPISNKETQGLIFPRGYEYSERWGFGLKNIGYYIPINDFIDLTASTDFYLKGTWGLSLNSNFKKLYRFNGSVNVGYYRQRNEASNGEVSFDPSMSFRMNYNQDSRAHPSRRIGGSINIQFNDYAAANFNDAQSVLTAQYSSNFSYNQNFIGKPYSLSAALTHSQNRRSGQMTINFPNLNFQTQTVYPFKHRDLLKKDGTRREEKWYEEIAFRYQGELRASVTGVDTLSKFFQVDSLLQGLKLGSQHRTTLNTSFRLLKNLNVTPSVNYTNSLNFGFTQFTFDNNIISVFDTIYNPADSSDFNVVERIKSYGSVEEEIVNGIIPIHEYSASLSLNTTLYRTLRFKKGYIKGIRHVMRPTVSMNFAPNYLDPNLPYYNTYTRRDANGLDTIQYSIFQNGLYRAPSSGEQMALSYSITNIYEAKYYSKKDSIDKKVKLFDNLYLSGNYNFAADSLKFSDIAASGVTRLFKGLSTFNFNLRWSPYQTNNKGQRIDEFYWEATKKPLRFDEANFQFSTSLSIREIEDLFKGEMPTSSTQRNNQDQAKNTNKEEERLIDWFADFNISHNYGIKIDRLLSGSDTLMVQTNSINLTGRIPVTKKWNVNVGNIGYDFKSKGFSYPAFQISRDLHCWSLAFDWYPQRRVYSLSLFVTSSPLDFIRIPYRRNQADGQFSGF